MRRRLCRHRDVSARLRFRFYCGLLIALLCFCTGPGCSLFSTDCDDGVFCDPFLLALSYRQPLVGVGSSFDSCRTFREDLPGALVSTGQYFTNGCKFLGGVTTGLGRYIAAGSDQLGDGPTTQCVILTSANGRDWAPLDCAPTAGSGLSPVAFGNGVFVASSTGNLAAQLRVSTDGVSWASRAAGTTQGIEGFLFANGVFYAASKDGVYASSDPVNIAFTTTGSGTEQYEQLVQGADGRIVAVGNTGGGLPIAKVLQDGAWTTGSGIFGNATGGELPAQLVYDGLRFIAIGSQSTGTDADCFVDWSYDGLTWNGGYSMHPACTQASLNWQAISVTQSGLETIVVGFVFSGTATVSVLRTVSVESGQWSHAFEANNHVIADMIPAQ